MYRNCITACVGRTVGIGFLLLAVHGCDDDPLKPKVCPTGPRAVVTTTDYSSGSLSTVALDGSHAADDDVASISSDAVVRVFGGRVYVVNRFGADNVQVLAPDNCFSPVRQFSVGNGSDPHDIVVVSDSKAYVTRYNTTELWIVDPTTGALTGSVDLSSYADPDGTPEADQLALAGGRLFVTLQRIDRNSDWGPTDASYIAVIDVEADTLIDADPVAPGTQAIVLDHTNPFSTLQVDPASGDLYVACVGEWGGTDGGVAAVDPVALAPKGTLLAGAAAGGDVTDVEIVSAERGYVIITNANFHTTLLAFDPRSGTVVDTVYAPGDFVLQDVELAPTGEIFVADRTATAPGLRVYDAATGVAKGGGAIDVGLPPFSIAFTE